MKQVLMIALSVAAMGTTSADPAAAQSANTGVSLSQDQLYELTIDLRDKALACAREGKSACAETCKSAMTTVRESRGSDQTGVDACRSLAAPGEAAAAKRQAGVGLLDDRYAWMGDVEGVIAGRMNSRRGINVVANSNPEWVANCASYAKPHASIPRETLDQLEAGIRVRLRHVQQDKTLNARDARAGKCVFGAIDILG